MALVENLEETKRTAVHVAEQVRAARDSEVRLSAAREVYRPVAARGALMYFLSDSLPALDRVYHFSLANFIAILRKGDADNAARMSCMALKAPICWQAWTSRLRKSSRQTSRGTQILRRRFWAAASGR